MYLLPGTVAAREDHHMFHFTHRQLMELLAAAQFTIVREHWQKFPFDYCIYVSATRG